MMKLTRYAWLSLAAWGRAAGAGAGRSAMIRVRGDEVVFRNDSRWLLSLPDARISSFNVWRLVA